MGWVRGLLLSIIIATLLAAGGVYFLRFCEEQKISWMNAGEKIQKQQLAIEALQREVQGVLAQLKDAVAVQNERFRPIEDESREVGSLLPEMRSSIEQIKAVISQSRVEALMIKDDAKQWQKDYVAVLLELEERLNAVDVKMKELQERSPENAIGNLQQEVSALKNDMKHMSEQIDRQRSDKAASSPAQYPPLPRFDPDWKK
jgi:chromosome segregation ATPase